MNWEIVTGISSAVIALCALGYTIWQGKQTQKHNRLSVKPHIASWSHRNKGDGFYKMEIINNGLGPALIESFTITVDEEEITGNESDVVTKTLELLFPGVKYKSTASALAREYAMAAKERCTIIELQFTEPKGMTFDEIDHAFNRADLRIKYKSFYGDKYTFTSESEVESQ